MRTLRDILSRAFTHGFGVLLGFILGALLIAFARDPVERFVIPKAMAMLGGGQIMEIYSLQEKQKSFTTADAVYAIYWPGSTGDLSGRVILRNPDGTDSTEYQSELTGFRQSNVLSFTYRTVAEGRTGIGSFFGTFDQDAKAYIGTVTGYMHDDHSNNCSVERVIAVVGNADAQDKFLELANASLKRGAVEAQPGSQATTCLTKS